MEIEDPSQRTLWDILGPTVYTIVSVAMNLSFVAAGIAALYLLYGIFSGQLAGVDSLPRADQVRLTGVVDIASQILTWGLGIGTICLALVFLSVETTGYLILAAALGLMFGLPFVYTTFGGNGQGRVLGLGLLAFRNAALLPTVVGGLLVVYDVIRRFVVAFQNRDINPERFTYGNDARAEGQPRRFALGKCWQEPYCRDSIREHCPIFVSRKTCWKERRGCYCEEEIVTTAAAKVQGIILDMAPNAQRNFANSPTPGASRNPMTVGEKGIVSMGTQYQPRRVELTMAEKRERCRNCVIYNEHQREKYNVLLPLTILGTVALCIIFAPAMKQAIMTGFDNLDVLLARISFRPGATGTSLTRPNDMAAWFVVVAVSVMILSKLLQLLEWACFKIKI